MSKESLPRWIPGEAAAVYFHCRSQFTDAEWLSALERLFRSDQLREFWQRLSPPFSFKRTDGWNYFVGVVVQSIDVVNLNGRPSIRGDLLRKRKDAKRQLAEASKLARKLSDLLDQVSEVGATIPGEVYSTRALLRATFSDHRLSAAHCEREVEAFWRRLSSAQTSSFPSPSMLLSSLARSMDNPPEESGYLYASQKVNGTSRAHYCRALREELTECDRMYESDLLREPNRRLRETDIIALVAAVTDAPSEALGAIESDVKRVWREPID